MQRLTFTLLTLLMLGCADQPEPISGLWESSTLDFYSAYSFVGDQYENRTIQAFPYVEASESGTVDDLQIGWSYGGSAAMIDGLAHVPGTFGFQYSLQQLTTFHPDETARIAYRDSADSLNVMVAVDNPFPLLILSDGTDSIEIDLIDGLLNEPYQTTWRFNGIPGTAEIEIVDATTAVDATIKGCAGTMCILGYFRYGRNS